MWRRASEERKKGLHRTKITRQFCFVAVTSLLSNFNSRSTAKVMGPSLRKRKNCYVGRIVFSFRSPTSTMSVSSGQGTRRTPVTKNVWGLSHSLHPQHHLPAPSHHASLPPNTTPPLSSSPAATTRSNDPSSRTTSYLPSSLTYILCFVSLSPWWQFWSWWDELVLPKANTMHDNDLHVFFPFL